MRVLFDLAHPAHVHLYRNLILRVQKEGGAVLVATRDKDVTVALCEAYGIPQIVLSRARGSPFSALRHAQELFVRTRLLLSHARRFGPDCLVGSSASIGPIGRILGRPSFVFTEDDASVARLFALLTYPFCHYLVTPASLKHEDHGRKHLTYPGYHELAYLHPNHFTPNPSVPRALGLEPDQPYFIVRLVALTGHHDARARGLGPEVARELVRLLAGKGRVLISAEEALPPDLAPYRFPLPPEKLHDILAFASLYVGDSQTMTAEAAVLGVPSLRCNTFVGQISYLEELEHKYGLTRGFRPDQSGELLAQVRESLADLAGARAEKQARRRQMLAECVDLAEWQWQLLRDKGDKGGRELVNPT